MSHKMIEWEALEVSPSTKSAIDLERVFGVNYLGTLEPDWVEVCFMKG